MEYEEGLIFKRKYAAGYGMSRLARQKYTYIYIDPLGEPQEFAYRTRDKGVFYDYAIRSIPRTIDYTAGLINYFFRGQLGIAGGEGKIYIINKSANGNVPQALKGGEFELYYEDCYGIRTKVSDFSIAGWGPTNILPHNGRLIGTYNPFTAPHNPLPDPLTTDWYAKYVLVYVGDINPNSSPDVDDPYDPNAVAVGDFRYDHTYTLVVYIDEGNYDTFDLTEDLAAHHRYKYYIGDDTFIDLRDGIGTEVSEGHGRYSWTSPEGVPVAERMLNQAGTGWASWAPGVWPAWDAGTFYRIDDRVSFDGRFYRCIQPNLNIPPPNAAYWEVP